MTTRAEILAALVRHRRATDRAARDAASAAVPEEERLRRARAAAEEASGDAHAHAAARAAEAAARTAALDAAVERLRSLLADAAATALDFDGIREAAPPSVFEPHGLDVEEPAPEPERPSPPPGLLAKVLPSTRARYEEAVAAAERAHEQALAEHAQREARRREMLDQARAEHDRMRRTAEADAAARDREIDALRAAVEAGEPQAVAAWCAAVLAASDLPDGFPRRAVLAYDPANRLAVVDYELPGLDVVPAVQAWRYDRGADAFDEVPRPPARRKDLYTVVVASTALRAAKEIFDASRAVDRVVLNGYVQAIDRATGEAVRPYLVSIRTTREELRMIEVERTDPIVALRSLEAALSTNAAELAAVRADVGVREVAGAHLASSPDL